MVVWNINPKAADEDINNISLEIKHMFGSYHVQQFKGFALLQNSS